MGFMRVSFVKLFISLVLTFLCEYQSLSALRCNEAKVKLGKSVYNTTFLHGKQRSQWLRQWEKHSTTKKVVGLRIARMQNDMFVLNGRTGTYSNDDIEIAKRQSLNRKGVRYDLNNQDKRSADSSKRLRRYIESENQNMTEQSVQCEVAALSCRNCCGNSTVCPHVTKFCRCDPQCTFYNDCCVDHETFCGKKRPVSFGVSPRGLSCVKPEHVDVNSDSKGIWMFNRCPLNRNSDEISRNCETVDDLEFNIYNIRNFIPVVGKADELIFRNEFCAKCNGIEQFEYFGFRLTCYVVPPVSISSFAQLIEFASKYCVSKEWISIFREDNQPIRECNQFFRHLCPTMKELKKKCSSRHERNCLLKYHWCNLYQYKWDEQAVLRKCGREILPAPGYTPTASFASVVRFSKGPYGLQVQETECPRGQFYDQYLDACRVGQSIPPEKENLDKYLIAIWLDVSKTAGRLPTLNETICSFAKLFNFPRSQASEVSSITIGRRGIFAILFKFQLSNEQTLLLAKSNYTTTSDAVLHSENNVENFTNTLSLSRLLFFSGKFTIKIRNETVTVFKTTSRQLACIRKQTHAKGTYTLVQNGEYYYINSTGKKFAKSKVFFEDSVNQSISICEKIVFSNCVGRRINLTSEEYVSFDNLSIFYKRRKTVYDFGQYDIEDGKIVMCIPGNQSTKSSLSNFYVIQTYITFASFILSLICLFLVIQTYIIFAELRNLPGMNILSLALSLFLAQLLWLIPYRQHTSTVCHVVAVIQHYLFLVSFVAMATIAWDTYNMFACTDVRNAASRRNEKKKFYKYSAFVWGLPAIFVVTCALVDRQGVYAVYANEQPCWSSWFHNAQAQNYLFVLPVGLVLLLNVVFFVLTVFRIHHVRSTTRAIRADQGRRTMFWVYLKLSSLMGFCWLFGFLDLLVKSSPVFTYLFVVFASLQGVYIALAFVMKKQIWEKYKKLLTKCCAKRKPDHGSTLLDRVANTKETRL